jgi:DNA topoisomerase-1
MAAQEMYQGIKMGEEGNVALITYIRTDSVRVAPEAQAACKEYITEKFGAEYAPETYNMYKSKKSAQDAHEAIRPTHMDITPEMAAPYLNADQVKLYRLIYNRFLASQMSEATFNSVAVDIDANSYGFRVTGRTPIFLGWQAAYGVTLDENKKAKKEKDKDDDTEDDEKKDDEDGAKATRLPELNEQDLLTLIKLEFAQKFTKPPARYTEATLVKAMEEKGIGRPATYNPIIQNITARYYIEKEGKALKPTELGFIVTDFLEKYFADVMDIEFTANMEDKLDDIAYDGIEWQGVVDSFYKPFIKEVATALDGEDNIKIALEETDIPCSKCGKMMVVRMGRYGKFLACPGFPECRNILPYDKPICKCPLCADGNIYKRKSKKGRIFYGCSSYPNCDFVSWDTPTGTLCPKCGRPLQITSKVVKCSNRECDYVGGPVVTTEPEAAE